MNPISGTKTESKSTQKLLLLLAVGAFATAALFLGLLFYHPSRLKVPESFAQPAKSASEPADLAVQPAEGRRSSPSWSPAAQAAKGFDLFFKEKDYVGAIAIFQACVLEHPDYADAYDGLAMAQREAGDPATALPNHDRSIKLSPERADYYRVRGITYQRLQHHDAAIESFALGLARKTRSMQRISGFISNAGTLIEPWATTNAPMLILPKGVKHVRLVHRVPPGPDEGMAHETPLGYGKSDQ